MSWLADLIAPFVMWGAISVVVLAIARYVYRKHEDGIRARENMQGVGDAQEDRNDASRTILKNRNRMRVASLRGWLTGVRNRTRS